MFWLVVCIVTSYLLVGELFSDWFLYSLKPTFTFNGRELTDLELYIYSTLLWPIAVIILIRTWPEQ